jgi:glycosyltransferase involved in cell wall biosynthesis
MIYVVSSTNKTGISMSAQGYLRPLRVAGIDHEFVDYRDFLKDVAAYQNKKCLIVPVPSAWRFTLKDQVPFINAFVCESNVIPESDAKKLRYIEQIWTPSRFCQKVLFNNHFASKYVPYSMEMPLRECTKNQKVYTFLCSFDGKFTIHRKGIIHAITAFKRAFEDIENVAMVIKTFDLKPASEKLLNECINGDKRITIKTNFVETVDEIYDDVDCYVSLHASEGFGRHIAEAMLRKITVICTNYGGNTDFCTPETAKLVDGEFINHKHDAQYHWNGLWIYPNILHAQLHMRRLYEGWVHTDVEKAYKQVKSMYSDEAVANIIKKIL